MAARSEKMSYLLCTDNSGFAAALEVRKIYRVLADPSAKKRGLVRVIDESGEDYLYPTAHFVSIEIPAEAARLLAAEGQR